MPNTSAKANRLEARIAKDALVTIRRAAQITGRSVSDFVVQAAQDAALKAIEQAQIVRLAAKDQALFARAMAGPPPVSAALRRAASRHKKLIAPR